jgi:uncharacterized protein YndB with AHSA1/START domain
VLKKILLVLFAIVVLFVIVVALQPSHYSVQRSTTIAAPVDVVFEQVNDFHKFAAWNPWSELDPKMKETFEGPSAGVGATHSWSGNDQVGEGRHTIVESKPGELIRIKLEFVKPFAGVSMVNFTFKNNGANTDITWQMEGENNFVCKAFCLFMNMDKMVGGDFERGLAKLKTVAEAAAAKK